MAERLDIHKSEERYQKAKDHLKQEADISPRNKKLILDFLTACELGKTIKKKAKKKIGARRCSRYLSQLRILSNRMIKKDFDVVTLKEMETFIADLESGKFKAEHNKIQWKDGKSYYVKTADKTMSESNKIEYKKTLMKFYKWMKKPELIDWFDTSKEQENYKAVRREDINILVEKTKDPLMKTFIQVGFDSGCRVEELLNIKLEDVEFLEDQKIFAVHIYGGKNKYATRDLPLKLAETTPILKAWKEAGHPTKKKTDYLFPIQYANCRKKLKTLGNKYLPGEYNLTPHALRHCSATYWGPRMNHKSFCKFFGWSFGSDMPNRYMDRAMVEFKDFIEEGDADKYKQIEKKYQEENEDLKKRLELVEQALIKSQMMEETIIRLHPQGNTRS